MEGDEEGRQAMPGHLQQGAQFFGPPHVAAVEFFPPTPLTLSRPCHSTITTFYRRKLKTPKIVRKNLRQNLLFKITMASLCPWSTEVCVFITTEGRS